MAFPARYDDIEFAFMATNLDHNDEHLIATKAQGKDFFLLVKDVKEKKLLKSDKISRPSSTYLVKKALLAYADASGCKKLESNVNDDEQNIHLVKNSALKTIHYFAECFPTGKEVRIEVGFGSGRHLLHQAKKNPDILFIGIEIHRPSIDQMIKQINIQKLDNVMLLDYDARLFLELVPSNTVGRIYVHFPVPWDKKPHRRVISETFIKESIRVLMPDGRLELRTDSDNYYDYAFQTFNTLNYMHIEIFKNRDISVKSKYEERWRRQEKNIYDIILHNKEKSPELEDPGSFDFPAEKYDMAKLKELNGTTHRFKGGFIHFERLYKTNDDRYLFRLSMGAFERPEHLYLLIGKDELNYFPSAPIRSKGNLKAHKILRGLLHG